MFPNAVGKYRIRLSVNRGAAWPSPHALVFFMTSFRSITSSTHASTVAGPLPSNRSTSRWVPIRQGKHFPHDSSAKNSIDSRVTLIMSRSRRRP